jgi:RimJ/RimL family protein N-acetyltransferase
MSQPASGEVTLRPFERRHLAATLAWANDPELGRLLDRAKTIPADEHERWFESLAGRADTRYFAIETGGRHVGNVWLADIDERHSKAEVRIVMGLDAVGRGCGSQALQLIAEHALGALGLRRLYAYVLAFNPRAKRAFEKAGFELEGTLRQDRLAGATPVDVFVLGRVKTSPRN